MSLEQFPMFRLATLLARQLSAPLANRIKVLRNLTRAGNLTHRNKYATTNPVARRVVIASAGRVFHAAELRFRLWSLRLAAPARPPSLSDADAVNVGADIIGEMIIFALGAAIVTFEVSRQAGNQEIKALEERSQWVAVLVALDELRQELRLQQDDIDRLVATLRDLPAPTEPPPPPPPPPPSTPAPQTTPTKNQDPDKSKQCIPKIKH